MTLPPAVDPIPEDDPRPARLAALMWALRGHQFTTELADDVLTLSPPDRPEFVAKVRCARRASDGGRLWYVGEDGRQIAEAEEGSMAFALTAIKELTADRT